MAVTPTVALPRLEDSIADSMLEHALANAKR